MIIVINGGDNSNGGTEECTVIVSCGAICDGEVCWWWELIVVEVDSDSRRWQWLQRRGGGDGSSDGKCGWLVVVTGDGGYDLHKILIKCLNIMKIT